MEPALTEGTEQGGLAYTRVANQDHLKQTVWGKEHSFFCSLKVIQHRQLKSGW